MQQERDIALFDRLEEAEWNIAQAKRWFEIDEILAVKFIADAISLLDTVRKSISEQQEHVSEQGEK